MKWKEIKNQRWYPYTVAVCCGVLLYVVLTNLPSLFGIFGRVGGYFKTVIIGGMIAYLINPVARFLERTVFSKMKKNRWTVSAVSALVVVMLVFIILLLTVIPQLFFSIRTFISNIDTYIESLENILAQSGLSDTEFFQNLIASSNDILDSLGSLLSENLEQIVSASANIGKSIANFGIAMILSLYFLAEKATLKKGTARLMKATCSERTYDRLKQFYLKCDSILSSYISCSLFESLIVGGANAIFMKITGMDYIGLVSIIVGLTNLIPTFGPMIGGAIGAFILLLVNPMHALIFIIFTFILQTIDGYVIKPKLFGNSLGVSGLMILIAVIVFGKIFGVTGIILSIPAAAIIQYAYSDLFLAGLERRKKENPQT